VCAVRGGGGGVGVRAAVGWGLVVETAAGFSSDSAREIGFGDEQRKKFDVRFGTIQKSIVRG
jgi:hypothetical protein